jgi:hypothetical protein
MKSFKIILMFALGLGLSVFFPLASIDAPKEKTSSDRIQSDKKGSKRTSHASGFSALSEQALIIPEQDFEKWLEAHPLDHLSREERSLIHGIIKERWSLANPEACFTYLLANGERPLTAYLGNWVAQNKENAIHFLDSVKPKQKQYYLNQLMSVLAESDPVTAVELLGKHFDGTHYLTQETFVTIATEDREALLDLIGSHPSLEKFVIPSIGAAWLDKDIPWVVKMLEETNSDVSQLNLLSNFTSKPIGKSIIENLDQLPDSWIDFMATRGALMEGANIDWLQMKSHPRLDQATLSQIQDRAASALWTRHWNLDEVAGVLSDGSWLSPETQAMLVKNTVRRLMMDRADIQPFISKLSPQFANQISEQYEAQISATEIAGSLRPIDSPEGFVQSLQDDSRDLNVPPSAKTWGQTNVEAAVRHAQAITAEQAQRALSEQSWKDIPPELAATLVEKLAPESEIISERAAVIATNWGRQAPEKAAAWAAGLEAGEARKRAIANVVSEWTRYDEGEAETWVRSLEAADRALIESK